MTYPGPTTNRRRLPYHSEAEMLELEARNGIHAGMLAGNADRAEYVDGVTGIMHAPEQDMRGWSAQQPFAHVDCPVTHVCILCARRVDPDGLRDHHCKVALELKAA